MSVIFSTAYLKDMLEPNPDGSMLRTLRLVFIGGRKSQDIAAGIDVSSPEPPPKEVWFRRRPSDLATPHIAGGTLLARMKVIA